MIAGATVLLWTIGAVFSQETPEKTDGVQKVVVAGTLIKHPDLSSLVPISTISPEQIQSTGSWPEAGGAPATRTSAPGRERARRPPATVEWLPVCA